MKVEQKNGFSLVELMVGMVSASILALVFSAVLIYGSKGWWRLYHEAEMQCDADVAMRKMDKVIRGASNATWGVSGLSVVMTNGAVHLFSKSGSWPNGDLLYTPPGGSATLLIDNRLNTFSGIVWSNMIVAVTNFSLKEGLETLDMPFSIFMRN